MFVDTGTGGPDSLRPSYVKACGFHHGFATAIGLFGCSSIQIYDNVIHRTVGPGKTQNVHYQHNVDILIQRNINNNYTYILSCRFKIKCFVGIHANGADLDFRRNLLTMSLFIGAWRGREDFSNFKVYGSFELVDAVGYKLIGNHVAGSQKAAFRFDGERCSTSSLFITNG